MMNKLRQQFEELMKRQNSSYSLEHNEFDNSSYAYHGTQYMWNDFQMASELYRSKISKLSTAMLDSYNENTLDGLCNISNAVYDVIEDLTYD